MNRSGFVSSIFEDISSFSPAKIVNIESALTYQIITPNNRQFRPNDTILRSEAYAMIMASVCMYPTGPSQDSWEKKLYDAAYSHGFTIRNWDNFEAKRPILQQELFVLASHAADWAERTG